MNRYKDLTTLDVQDVANKVHDRLVAIHGEKRVTEFFSKDREVAINLLIETYKAVRDKLEEK